MPDRPNIVLVHAHNAGQQFGCYGWDVETPHVDGLAADGARLDNHFATAAQCSPARSSLWTGQHPHVNGMVGLAHLGWELDDESRNVVARLSNAGYRTRLIGLQHVTTDPAAFGFDVVDGSLHGKDVGEPADEVAARAETYLQAEAARETEEPFFASVGFSEVHREPRVDRCLGCGWTFDVPGYDGDDPEDVEPLPYLPDHPDIREELAAFRGMVHAVDEGVGRVAAALDATGLAEETLLVFTTDHGIGFPRAMGTCYDPGVETALIARHPDVEADDHDDLVSGVDFAPTLLDAAGEPIPGWMSGQSVWPLLTGEADWEDGHECGVGGDGAPDRSEPVATDRHRESDEYVPRDHVFHEYTWHVAYNPMRAIRTPAFKYVRNFGSLPLVSIPAFESKSARVVREEFYGTERPREELYALREDPHEQRNRVDDPAFAEIGETLATHVDDWMAETDDRLCDGDWPPTDEQFDLLRTFPWDPRPR